jgi:hypothetical protein
MTEREKTKLWVDTWKQAGPELEAIRRQEIAELDTLRTLIALEDAFNHAAESLPPRPTSGMVEMQQYLAKLNR